MFYRVAWESYVGWTQAHSMVLPILHDEYSRAIERIGNAPSRQGSSRLVDQANTFGDWIPKPDFGLDTNTNRLTVPSGYTMSYDSAGNLLNDTYTGQGQRTYDAENRMKQVWANNQWQTYSYDGDGRRVKRLVHGTETWQIYGVGGELLAEYAANTAPTVPQKEYAYRNGQLLVTATAPVGTGTGLQGQYFDNMNFTNLKLTRTDATVN